MDTIVVIEIINAAFNVSHLVLLFIILMFLLRERTRADRLEESNRRLTRRFIKLMLKLPPGFHLTDDELENDLYPDKYPKKKEDK